MIGDAGPSRRLRSEIAWDNLRGTATSAIRKNTYRECGTTFASILISLPADYLGQWAYRIAELTMNPGGGY